MFVIDVLIRLLIQQILAASLTNSCNIIFFLKNQQIEAFLIVNFYIRARKRPGSTANIYNRGWKATGGIADIYNTSRKLPDGIANFYNRGWKAA
jgi:hypothetical protein